MHSDNTTLYECVCTTKLETCTIILLLCIATHNFMIDGAMVAIPEVTVFAIADYNQRNTVIY